MFVVAGAKLGTSKNNLQPSEAQNQCKYTYEDGPGGLLTSIEITICL